MKKLLLILTFLLLGTLSIFAQDITGSWKGVLEFQGTKLTVVFNILKNETGFVSTMDSPDQGQKGIPVTSTTFENKTLNLKISAAGIEYTGEMKTTDSIEGNFKQAGMTLPLNLTRVGNSKSAVINRPQEPKPPFSYKSEDVKFNNPLAKINLAGTLTFPSTGKDFPAVVLITGSGAQNRNEEILGHKPFLVLADYLTRNGIAVLRYDDRGIGESEGNPAISTSQDFATDVEAAISYLKTRPEINKQKIGLIGHSEGGMIAPMVAAKSKDVAFIVLLAGTGVSGEEVLLSQSKALLQAAGATQAQVEKAANINKGAYEIAKKDLSQQETKKQLVEYFQSFPEVKDKAESEANFLALPWMKFFIKYQPSEALKQVKCPVLALNGEKDLQVLPKLNLPAIKEILEKSGNKQVTVKEFPQLNHLFQECKTCLTEEYGELEQTISPKVLDEITNWIKRQTK